MKKIIMAAALSLAAFVAFAQQSTGKGPDFKNKTSSGIVNVEMRDNAETIKSFAGIVNNTKVELLSGKVDCGIDASVIFKSDTAYDKKYVAITGVADENSITLNDWYIEFRPFDKITFAISDKIYTHGSYFPVLGTNLDSGNLGSDVVAVWRPIGGMRIGFGYDVPSYFGKTLNDAGDKSHCVFNFGADYTYGNKFSVGFVLRDMINDISAGFYGEILAVEHLYVTYGYTYNDSSNYYGIYGKNLISLGATYDFEKVGFGLDFLTNCGDDAAADFYIGVNSTIKATDAVKLGLKFQTAIDKDESKANKYEINPSISYAAKAWGCGAGVDVVLTDASTTLSFPVYFEFSL